MNSGGPSPRWEIGEVRSGGVGGGGWLSLFVLYLIIFCVALVSALFVLFQDTIPVLGVREVYASVELGGGSYSFISYVHNVHFHHLHWLLLAALVLSCVAASFKVGAEAEYGRFRSYVVGYGAFLVSVVLYLKHTGCAFCGLASVFHIAVARICDTDVDGDKDVFPAFGIALFVKLCGLADDSQEDGVDDCHFCDRRRIVRP